MCPANQYGLIQYNPLGNVLVNCQSVVTPADTTLSVWWTPQEATSVDNTAYVAYLQNYLAIATGIERKFSVDGGKVGDKARRFDLTLPSVAAQAAMSGILTLAISSQMNITFPLSTPPSVFTNTGDFSLAYNPPIVTTTSKPSSLDGASHTSAALAFSAVAFALLA
jgi:hypothetical protein